tara:strand:+ start:966 stop:1310 length:345 start_codon:yes stop_codon:yes gene_type:complete
MIRHDGYYVFKPTLFEPREGLTNNYYVSAYCFYNSKVRSVSKYTKDRKDIFFKKEDFNEDFVEHCYQINEDEIYFIYKCEKNGDKFYYDRITDKKIKSRRTGQIMKFIPWKKQK